MGQDGRCGSPGSFMGRRVPSLLASSLKIESENGLDAPKINEQSMKIRFGNSQGTRGHAGDARGHVQERAGARPGPPKKSFGMPRDVPSRSKTGLDSVQRASGSRLEGVKMRPEGVWSVKPCSKGLRDKFLGFCLVAQKLRSVFQLIFQRYSNNFSFQLFPAAEPQPASRRRN